MAQEGTSLSAVAQNGTYVGTTVTPTNPFANASMVVSMSGYAGSGIVTVALQVSHDGTNWATVGVAYYGASQNYVNVQGCPGVSLRAVITNWAATVTAGTVTATVCGV